VPNSDPIPAYSPPIRAPNEPSRPPAHHAGAAPPRTTLLPSPRPDDAPTVGLPPIPAAPHLRRPEDALPALSAFRIPTWSNVSRNPTARHYHSVALRRAAAATSTTAAPGTAGHHPTATAAAASATAAYLKRAILLDRISEDEGERRRGFRPLEDPHLVGEEAARRARAQRIAREGGATESVLIREDQRWSWFLGESRASLLPPFPPFPPAYHYIWLPSPAPLRRRVLTDWVTATGQVGHREVGPRGKIAGRIGTLR